LDEAATGTRDFDAIVIGEHHRAFSGQQAAFVLPVLEDIGIALWVPELGGPYDPENDAHDLILGVQGHLSNTERKRIQKRVRNGMRAQATMGRFLGGRPPYGYRLVDAGPHPNPEKARDGKRLHRLDPDPVAAPVVERIFRDFIGGASLGVIADSLNRDGILCPSAHDPKHNPQRAGTTVWAVAWGKHTVRAILRNPRYTGYEVWGKQPKSESLRDRNNVTEGKKAKQSWAPPETWARSLEPAHPAIVSTEDFDRAQANFRTRDSAQRSPRPTKRPYVLGGMVRCGLCNHAMAGNWNHGRANYRCRYPKDYPGSAIDHPPTVYLREDDVIGHLLGWLNSLFAPENLATTAAMLAEVLAAGDDGEAARRAALEAELAATRRKINSIMTAIEDANEATSTRTLVDRLGALEVRVRV
jgi:hypothetical protein